MQRYDYAKVSSDKGVLLHCTDSSELDALVSQLKQLYPKMAIGSDKLSSGELFHCYIKNLDERPAMWWIIRQLCSRGWEPLGAAVYASGNYLATGSDFHYQFKRQAAG